MQQMQKLQLTNVNEHEVLYPLGHVSASDDRTLHFGTVPKYGDTASPVSKF